MHSASDAAGENNVVRKFRCNICRTYFIPTPSQRTAKMLGKRVYCSADCRDEAIKRIAWVTRQRYRTTTDLDTQQIPLFPVE